MKGISFAGKMLIIGAIFTIPIALLVVVLYLQIKGDIDFASQERLGTAYTAALRPLFFDLEAYRIAGGGANEGRLAGLIDVDFITARAADAGVGAPLRLSKPLAAIAQKWRTHATADVLLQDTMALLVAVSDNSKITLDPILDGYYVGDTMVDKIPSLIDGIAQADVTGTQILRTGPMSQEQRISITILSGQMSASVAGIGRNIPIAVAAAPYLAIPLGDRTVRQHATSSAFLAAVQTDILTPDHATSRFGPYAQLAHAALTSAFALYDATISGLDDVLRKRIHTLVYHECLIFSIVLATIVGAALTMLITTRSIARRLGAVTGAIRTIVSEDMSQLVEIASAIARGDQSRVALVKREPLAADGRDEAAVLAQSYNSLTQRLADVNADFVNMTTQLSARAFHDELTELPNRALFMERVSQMIARNQRRNDHLAAVLFLDLDRFKLVNDSLGHLAGDLLLVAVARRLERCLRPGDTLARLGGDEFTFLIEDISSDQAATAFAERIMAALAHPFVIANHEMFATASIGIAITRTGYDSADDILRDADIAMYRSKQLGKNRCTVFAPELLARASALLQLDTDLMAAVQRREFVLYYQPIVALQTGELRGFEALIRWQHPQRGLLSPDEFIAAAEESGAILAIGAQVIEEACRQARLWRETFDLERPLAISVNVSARQFSNPRLIDEITCALATFGLSAEELHIEITESTIMANPDIAAATLAELRALGIAVHLDDFGTGYSSLGYLHRFPVSTIKIDRSFISMSGNGVGNPEIVATITSLAQLLSMETTVEGIETAEQLAHLRRLGCTNGQGYYFARPLTVVAATEFIARWQPLTVEVTRPR